MNLHKKKESNMEQVTRTFDPIWEETIWRQRSSRYPYDIVVSFVYKNYPRHKPRHAVKILEVGCGTGNNLWFAAREGFQVSGIDASPTAIAYAKKRFSEDGLVGHFCVGDFTQLPYKSDVFDLVIDRGAITCTGWSSAKKVVDEVRRVLQIGGRFLFNGYSDRASSSISGRAGPDKLRLDISAGTLCGVGQICFYGRQDIGTVFAQGWKLLSLQHLELTDMLRPEYTVHAEWRVIAEKIPK